MLTLVVFGVIFWAIILATMCLPEMIAERRYLAAQETRRSRHRLRSPQARTQKE